MAGKSNKGRNRRGASNAVVPSDAPVKDNSSASEPIKAEDNGVPAVEESTDASLEVKESETENSISHTKQGEFSIWAFKYLFLEKTSC